MAMDIPKEFKEVADIIQEWDRGKSVFGYDDVLVWWHGDELGVALRGDALRIERLVFLRQEINNSDYYFDYALQMQFGLDVELEYRGRTRPVGIKGGAGQTMPYQSAHYSEALSGIETVIKVYLERRGIEVDVHVTLMPKEGSPWEPAQTPTPYYNARKLKIETTPKPPWMIGVDVRSEHDSSYVKVPGVDFCKLMPTLKSGDVGSLMIHDPSHNIDFMVTHAFDFFRYGVGWKEMAKFINDCNGLLFPSMAVGQIPAATIGIIVFVVDPLVVLQGMKPYRTKKGRWPVVSYTTDAWTETTRDFLGAAAAEAFDQLTGQWRHSAYGKPHFYILGPKISTIVEDLGGKLFLDTKKLSTTISRRARVWHRGLSGEEIIELQDVLTTDRYPYIEAKANGIVSVDSLVACVTPSFLLQQTRAMLKAIGFQGEVISIPVTKAEAKALEDGTMYATLFDYSWRVHESVARMARETGRIELLQF